MEYTHEVAIPFAGFYHSIHDGEADREFEYIADVYAEEVGEDIPQSLMDLFCDTADYGNFHLEYARAYAENFIAEYLTGGEFVTMESPREYNFTTDRLFIKISRDEIARLWVATDRNTFDRIVKERFTSRSGFCSFYSNRWQDWGRLSEWDHNQLGALLAAYLDQQLACGWDQWKEYELMEHELGNGLVSNTLWAGDKCKRPWKILDYLRERARRPIKTLAAWRIANAKSWNDTPLGGLN
jgi:hypothetical protein